MREPEANDAFLTIARTSSAELRERGSRFIAEVFPISTAEDAEREIEEVRRREHSATHHCTAYRLGADAGTYRYNDDGEPSGTAGLPILRQIEGRDLTDTLVIVTRYFGGTKLGTGGLMRAYGAAASAALDAAGVVRVIRQASLTLVFRYEDTAPAMQVLHRFDAKVESSEYGEATRLRVSVPWSAANTFRNAYADALRGRGTIEPATT